MCGRLGLSDDSTRSIISGSTLGGVSGRLDIIVSTWSFRTVALAKRFLGLGALGFLAIVLMMGLAWGVCEVLKSAGEDEVSMMWSLAFGVLALILNFFTWGLAIFLKSKFVRVLFPTSLDYLRAASFAFVNFLWAVDCFEVVFFVVFFVVAFFGFWAGGFLAECFIGEIEYEAGAREGPGMSSGVDCDVDSGCGFLGTCSSFSVLRLRLSSKQNFCMFLLFRLYSPTVLHATKLIRRSLGSSAFFTRFFLFV